jgi:hypothetical protein
MRSYQKVKTYQKVNTVDIKIHLQPLCYLKKYIFTFGGLGNSQKTVIINVIRHNADAIIPNNVSTKS